MAIWPWEPLRLATGAIAAAAECREERVKIFQSKLRRDAHGRPAAADVAPNLGSSLRDDCRMCPRPFHHSEAVCRGRQQGIPPMHPRHAPKARHVRDPLDHRLAELTATHARVMELLAAKTRRRSARWRASQLYLRRPSSARVGALGLSLSTAARETSGAALPRRRRLCRPAARGGLRRSAVCSPWPSPDPLCAFALCSYFSVVCVCRGQACWREAWLHPRWAAQAAARPRAPLVAVRLQFVFRSLLFSRAVVAPLGATWDCLGLRESRSLSCIASTFLFLTDFVPRPPPLREKRGARCGR